MYKVKQDSGRSSKIAEGQARVQGQASATSRANLPASFGNPPPATASACKRPRPLPQPSQGHCHRTATTTTQWWDERRTVRASSHICRVSVSAVERVVVGDDLDWSTCSSSRMTKEYVNCVIDGLTHTVISKKERDIKNDNWTLKCPCFVFAYAHQEITPT